MHEGSLFSTSSLIPIISFVLDSNHSDRYEVIPHCAFDLHSLVTSKAEHLEMCLLATSVFFLKNVYSEPLSII